MKCVSFRVSGRVQGVGFRWATREQALSRNLAGWVRNDDEGSVSGLVQGPQPAVEDFCAWLSRGPAGARVTDLEVQDEAPTGLRLFVIRD